MSNFEVSNPILSSPFEEPKEHWWILEGHMAERREGRRPALYFYRDPKRGAEERGGIAIEMRLVNEVRGRVKAWRDDGYAGVTRTTLELLQHWRREGREACKMATGSGSWSGCAREKSWSQTGTSSNRNR